MPIKILFKCKDDIFLLLFIYQLISICGFLLHFHYLLFRDLDHNKLKGMDNQLWHHFDLAITPDQQQLHRWN